MTTCGKLCPSLKAETQRVWGIKPTQLNQTKQMQFSTYITLELPACQHPPFDFTKRHFTRRLIVLHAFSAHLFDLHTLVISVGVGVERALHQEGWNLTGQGQGQGIQNCCLVSRLESGLGYSNSAFLSSLTRIGTDRTNVVDSLNTDVGTRGPTGG